MSDVVRVVEVPPSSPDCRFSVSTRQCKNRTLQRSSPSHISTLPPELLAEIFVAHARGAWQDGKTIHPSESAILRVCRVWRDVARRTVEMWSFVVLSSGMSEGGIDDAVAQHLGPISNTQACGLSAIWRIAHRHSSRRLLHIAPLFPRIVELDMYVDQPEDWTRFIPTGTALDMPILRTLRLRRGYPFALNATRRIHAPSLRILAVDAGRLLCLTGHASLSELCVEPRARRNPPWSWDELVEILARFPARSVRISIWGVAEPTRSAGLAIEDRPLLSETTCLELVGVDKTEVAMSWQAGLLQRIRFPALSTLTLHNAGLGVARAITIRGDGGRMTRQLLEISMRRLTATVSLPFLNKQDDKQSCITTGPRRGIVAQIGA